MTIFRNDQERLAHAALTGDVAAAEATLTIMAATKPNWALALQNARRRITSPAPLPDSEPFPLPMDGAKRLSTLGDDPRHRVGKGKIGVPTRTIYDQLREERQ